MPPKNELLRKRILENVSTEILIELAKQQEGHKASEFYKDKETLVDEVFRLCSAKTLEILSEEFPGPSNFTAWLYRPASSLTSSQVSVSLSRTVNDELRNGLKPTLSEEPVLFRVEGSSHTAVFRFVAADQEQNLRISFGEKETVRLLSYYDGILHFSDVVAVVFGPFASRKADQIVQEVDSFLGLNGQWSQAKPNRGESREFYRRIKKTLKALLIETKRHDPAGNYKTVALEARNRHPDLEQVPDFKKHYFDADSYYDVLQFTFKNKLGLLEVTHVKFGRPMGRFTFKQGTSLSAILYFESKVRELLRGRKI